MEVRIGDFPDQNESFLFFAEIPVKHELGDLPRLDEEVQIVQFAVELGEISFDDFVTIDGLQEIFEIGEFEKFRVFADESLSEFIDLFFQLREIISMAVEMSPQRG